MGSHTAIKIRPALPKDAATIHAMVQELARALELENKTRGTVEDFLKYGFGKNANFNALIAERDGFAVGMCTYFPIFSSWSGQPGIFVLDLIITESERGGGLGELLLAEVAARGQENGAAFLRLSVDDHNVRAQVFYRRIGFCTMDEERCYQINTENFESLAARAGEISL